MHFFLLAFGLFFLWLGAELIVKGSQNISEHFKISSVFLGLTIVSLGTSLPEIAVSVSGAFDRLAGIETSDLVMGNIIGSALNQITILIGIIGLVSILYVEKKQLYRDGIMLLFAILLVIILTIDFKVTFIDSIILIIFYGIFLFTLFKEEKVREKFKLFPPKMHLVYDVGRLLLGIVILYFAAGLVLDNGKTVAEMYGIAESTVGIIIIGLGTGIPELVVSLTALRKKAIGLSLGNLLGSNITDLLFSLGAGTLISQLDVKKSLLVFDLPVLFVVTIVTLLFFRTKEKLERKEALVLLGIFAVYVTLKFGFKL